MSVLGTLRAFAAWIYAFVFGHSAASPFEETVLESPDGKARATLIGLGATLVELWVPDANGVLRDVVLGYDDRGMYLDDPAHPVFGAIVGRYAGRISNGSFTLDGKKYQLHQNDGTSTLHGGAVGWDRRAWTRIAHSKNSVSYELVDRAFEGFPGTVTARATYELVDGPELLLTIRCTPSERTPIVVSSHTYWNLDASEQQTTVHAHVMSINAHQRLETNGTHVPTGGLLDVAGTPWDFTSPHPVGERWDALIAAGGVKGYNENWVYERHSEDQPVFSLSSPRSGIRMDVRTNQKSVVVYSAGYLRGVPRKHGGPGVEYGPADGLAVEHQSRADAVNHPEWGENVIYGPGETLLWRTRCSFSVQQPDDA